MGKVHRLLIVFPVSFWTLAMGFDAVAFVSRSELWSAMAYWNLGAGLVAALVAGLFGGLAYLRVPPGTRASRMGLVHALLNITALGLMGASFGVRAVSREPSMTPWTLGAAVVGYGLVLVSSWIGRELATVRAVARAALDEV
jgi:uncharacterized membrane protein